jgi:hypothetical protein
MTVITEGCWHGSNKYSVQITCKKLGIYKHHIYHEEGATSREVARLIRDYLVTWYGVERRNIRLW